MSRKRQTWQGITTGLSAFDMISSKLSLVNNVTYFPAIFCALLCDFIYYGTFAGIVPYKVILIINFARYCEIYRAGKLIQYIFPKRAGLIFRRNYRERDVFEKGFVLCNEVFGF